MTGSAGSKRAIVRNDSEGGRIVVREEDLFDWLGPKRFHSEMLDRVTTPGVVIGLAWTAAGGEILFIEVTDIPGTGQLKLTGQMGEVMTESASIAWSYVKKHASANLKLGAEYFKTHDFHVHIPAGAIPKDGPSAGITMATALMSMLSGRRIRSRLAMTGELSLVGKVLPVGGIKEKILAAKRVGIRTLILPHLNEKDVAEVSKDALEGLRFPFVKRVEEVFELALEAKAPLRRRAKNPKRAQAELVRTGRRSEKVSERIGN